MNHVGQADDPRRVEHLIEPPSREEGSCSCFLSPLRSSLTQEENRQACMGKEAWGCAFNTITLTFDRPVSVAMIRFKNYSKTPERGARSFLLSADLSVVFFGYMPAADASGSDWDHTVVLSNAISQAFFQQNKEEIKRTVHYCGQQQLDVLCVNDGRISQESGRKAPSSLHTASSSSRQKPSLPSLGSSSKHQSRPVTSWS